MNLPCYTLAGPKSGALIRLPIVMGVGLRFPIVKGKKIVPKNVPKVLAQSTQLSSKVMTITSQETPRLKFWDDCADQTDIEALWAHPDVKKEWLAAGESPGLKVHMARAFDGPASITEVEMRAIAEITLERLGARIEPAMICAIAEIGSFRNPLAYHWDESVQEASIGLMQVRQFTVDWLASVMGYQVYTVDWTSSMLYRPFVNVYFGAAYLNSLATYEGKRRSEGFMIREYSASALPNGSPRRVSSGYWTNYLTCKQNILMKGSYGWTENITNLSIPDGDQIDDEVAHESLQEPELGEQLSTTSSSCDAHTHDEPSNSKEDRIHWDGICSVEDMAAMWNYRAVKKEWLKAGKTRGQVSFSLDVKLRPFLTMTELKAVAEIIITRFFSNRGLNPMMLCLIAEVSSQRLLQGSQKDGIMGLPFVTAKWLYDAIGYKSYRLRTKEDLSKPFVAMYFGSAYVCWLSNYGNRARTDEFVVRGYKRGLEAVDDAEAHSFWLQFLAAKSHYQHQERTAKLTSASDNREKKKRNKMMRRKSRKEGLFCSRSGPQNQS